MNLLLKKIKTEAQVYKIPYAEKETVDFICEIIKKYSIRTILEIGAGNGYSSVCFSFCKKVQKITTFEIDPNRIELSKYNIKNFSQINLIPLDFLKYNSNEKFDMIFIDGMKRKYIDFFNHAQNFCHEKSIIVSDNLNFANNQFNNEILSKHKNIVNKLREYIEFLKKNKKFRTEFYLKTGDGLAVTENLSKKP
ncbi:MAG: O-methyltransferase [Candidatus Muiribacteriota bacterium]